MRHAKPDSYKRAAGTLQARWTEEARAKRAIDNVLTFPQMKSIPAPQVPLVQGGPGEKSYYKWCDLLLQSNLLTAVSVAYVEQLAMADQKMHQVYDQGKMVPDRTLATRSSMLLKLDALNVDRAIVPDQGKENKFAHNGFPARLGKSAIDHA